MRFEFGDPKRLALKEGRLGHQDGLKAREDAAGPRQDGQAMGIEVAPVDQPRQTLWLDSAMQVIRAQPGDLRQL